MNNLLKILSKWEPKTGKIIKLLIEYKYDIIRNKSYYQVNIDVFTNGTTVELESGMIETDLLRNDYTLAAWIRHSLDCDLEKKLK